MAHGLVKTHDIHGVDAVVPILVVPFEANPSWLHYLGTQALKLGRYANPLAQPGSPGRHYIVVEPKTTADPVSPVQWNARTVPFG